MTRLAVTPPGQARNDWEILRALSEVLGANLPYDNITEVRFRIAELAPHLIKYDYIEPYNFSRMMHSTPGKLNNTVLSDYIDNFYMMDAYSRASPTMAKCTQAFNGEKLTNFPF
jgi:NADH dehydrogenase (ubiquinone) Fe-S protein 1